MKKILLLWAGGMLAYDFLRTQKEKFHIIPLGKNECDIASFESILQNIALYEPDVLLNCAAYTAVDDAEDVGFKENFEVNTWGVYNCAKAASVFGIDFITISTDYVFDGESERWYMPHDIPNPINAYGMAKYLGEKFALEAYSDTKIIRASWLYWGEILAENHEKYPDKEQGIFKNFVNTMLYLSWKHEKIRVIDDQFGRPTHVRDLSDFIAKIILENSHENIFHFTSDCDGGIISWADFAEKIFQKYGKNVVVERISSDEWGAKAKRPQYSLLLCE